MFKADEMTTSRRDILTRLLREQPWPAPPASMQWRSGRQDPRLPNPVLAVIRDHREAQEAPGRLRGKRPRLDECPRKLAAEKRAKAVELPLFTTRPATLLRVAALLLLRHL
jgi:hypothetical protein